MKSLKLSLGLLILTNGLCASQHYNEEYYDQEDQQQQQVVSRARSTRMRQPTRPEPLHLSKQPQTGTQAHATGAPIHVNVGQQQDPTQIMQMWMMMQQMQAQATPPSSATEEAPQPQQAYRGHYTTPVAATAPTKEQTMSQSAPAPTMQQMQQMLAQFSSQTVEQLTTQMQAAGAMPPAYPATEAQEFKPSHRRERSRNAEELEVMKQPGTGFTLADDLIGTVQSRVTDLQNAESALTDRVQAGALLVLQGLQRSLQTGKDSRQLSTIAKLATRSSADRGAKQQRKQTKGAFEALENASNDIAELVGVLEAAIADCLKRTEQVDRSLAKFSGVPESPKTPSGLRKFASRMSRSGSSTSGLQGSASSMSVVPRDGTQFPMDDVNDHY